MHNLFLMCQSLQKGKSNCFQLFELFINKCTVRESRRCFKLSGDPVNIKKYYAWYGVTALVVVLCVREVRRRRASNYYNSFSHSQQGQTVQSCQI